MVARYRDSERGASLLIVLLVMMLLSALMIGFMANIMADTRSSGVDRDETQVYAVAHAGMEKLTSDLSALFSTDYSPNGTQISNVAATSKQPVMPGFTYTAPDGGSGYAVEYTAQKVGSTAPCPGGCEQVQTPSSRTPLPRDPSNGTTITAGPYQGFKGLITRYNIMVTARSSGGSEVRMRRELQTVAVPVFQFGLFSESSLSFHSADDFDFGGRIHTNGNLYLAAGSGGPLTLSDKVTAVGEVVRRYLDNGLLSTSSYPGTVNIATDSSNFRALSATALSGNGEGSVQGNAGPGQVLTPTWTDISIGAYNGYIKNGLTGAKRLDLPLVTDGAKPIDLIRRPVVSENTSKPLVYQQRYYTQASLRILLSDTTADITGLPGIDTTVAPLSLEAGNTYATSPIATSMGSGNYKSTNGKSLIGGYIKIEKYDTPTSAWKDVTAEILGFGITAKNLTNGTANTLPSGTTAPNAGQNATAIACLPNEPQPNAILRIQRVKDVPSTHSGATAILNQYDCAVDTTGHMSNVSSDYWPLSLYDTREGLRRDETGPTSLYLGGVMYYVELNTANLAKWFKGTLTGGSVAGTGSSAKNDNGGYIVYFSDRRNNRNTSAASTTADGRLCGSPAAACFAANAETAEYGYEDIINYTTAGGADDGVMNTTAANQKPEDVNGDGVLETYGKLPNDGYGTANNVSTIGGLSPLDINARPTDTFTTSNTDLHVLRGNRPIFFRHALKLTNGSALRTSGLAGLTIASENPVYVQGDYNSTASDTAGETHIAAAIIADSITGLSNSWNDLTSFVKGVAPTTTTTPSAHSTMDASNTGYRFAAVMGKNISFNQPTGWTPETNFGMDGGAHNLLRLQENWDGDTMYYRGSIVSFYASVQAVGIFKCCEYVYKPPTNRVYHFDTDFLDPNKLPPGTPMFRDVNTLTFRQLLRPNQ